MPCCEPPSSPYSAQKKRQDCKRKHGNVENDYLVLNDRQKIKITSPGNPHNLLINMLSQTKNSTGDSLLDSTVHHIAECLIIMKVNRLPNAEQMIELLRRYPHDDIKPEMKRVMIAKLSDGIFKKH